MTSRFGSGGGLVQRRNVNVAPNTKEEETEEPKYEEEQEDHDSKEARLTLMEEVLLLGLKDREVGSSLEPAFRLYEYREQQN